MPYDEYLSWIAYRAKRGTLNLGTRIETGSALIAWAFRGGKVEDYIPQREQLSDDEALKKAKAEWF